MSEVKLITPLLADHLMGDPISNHHGVRCCPAIHKDTENKYIVKILSIPATQVQLEALLLSGAFPSKESALEYFKELADGVASEAEILRKLSNIEGFCGYEDWQIEPMEDGNGYDVYLLGSYKPTLERFYRSQPMTHLAAVNLGLDLCAALSVCRRNGYLYVDLKPSNVFIAANREYRIGDLGFIALDSLKYASMPERYRSVYTAPEITDAYASLNETLDVFSVGMILYQAYNNGQLPDLSQFPAQPLTPPMYADYEMAQIILKACAIDPADRWEDPAQMGQELVNYMQRNSVNDIPIVPPAEPVVAEPEVPEETADAPETDAEDAQEHASAEIAEEEITAVPVQLEDVSVQDNADEVADSADEDVSAPVEEDPAEPVITQEDIAAPEAAEEVSDEAEIPQEAPAEPVSEVTVSEEDAADIEDLTEPELESDDTLPSEEILSELEDAEVTDEVSAMLAQADDLIAHKTPDPVVAPEPIEIPIPAPIELTSDEEAQQDIAELPTDTIDDEEPSEPQDDQPAVEMEAQDDTAEETQEQETAVETAPSKKRHGGLIAGLIAVLIVLLLAVGAFFYYENYYLQRVDGITLNGNGDCLTVTLNTQISNELLTVYCTDTYGNKLQANVVNGSASFTGLKPGTNYKVLVEISGFHQLVGTTATTYTTDPQTTVLSFTAIAGDQDGSVILNFSVQDQQNTAWRVYYSTPGENEKFAECSGHTVNITGLTVGCTYTFRLEPVSDLFVVGEHTLEYTAAKVVYPQNLQSHGYSNGALQITWDVPAGVTVDSWTVRCYNNSGFDSTFTVSEPKASIEGLDPSESYTVDVKAAGMSVSQWISICANSITFNDILLDDSKPGELVITWNYEGVAPTDGWRLFYTINGGAKYTISCETNTCTISPLLPGAVYDISFDLPADYTIFGGTAQYTAPDGGMFDSYGVNWEDFNYRLCWTPADAGWRWFDLLETDFPKQAEFALGDKVSCVLTLDGRYEDSDDEINTLFVVRDAEYNILSINPGRTRQWDDMWSSFRGMTGAELDIPSVPQVAGEYHVDIYFNEALVTTLTFTVE